MKKFYIKKLIYFVFIILIFFISPKTIFGAINLGATPSLNFIEYQKQDGERKILMIPNKISGCQDMRLIRFNEQGEYEQFNPAYSTGGINSICGDGFFSGDVRFDMFDGMIRLMRWYRGGENVVIYDIDTKNDTYTFYTEVVPYASISSFNFKSDPFYFDDNFFVVKNGKIFFVRNGIGKSINYLAEFNQYIVETINVSPDLQYVRYNSLYDHITGGFDYYGGGKFVITLNTVVFLNRGLGLKAITYNNNLLGYSEATVGIPPDSQFYGKKILFYHVQSLNAFVLTYRDGLNSVYGYINSNGIYGVENGAYVTSVGNYISGLNITGNIVPATTILHGSIVPVLGNNISTVYYVADGNLKEDTKVESPFTPSMTGSIITQNSPVNIKLEPNIINNNNINLNVGESFTGTAIFGSGYYNTGAISSGEGLFLTGTIIGSNTLLDCKNQFSSGVFLYHSSFKKDLININENNFSVNFDLVFLKVNFGKLFSDFINGIIFIIIQIPLNILNELQSILGYISLITYQIERERYYCFFGTNLKIPKNINNNFDDIIIFICLIYFIYIFRKKLGT